MSHCAQVGSFCSPYVPLLLKLLSTHFRIVCVQSLGRHKILYQMVSGIFHIQSALNFFMFMISISYSHFQIFELLHIFSGYIRCLHVAVLLCILLMNFYCNTRLHTSDWKSFCAFLYVVLFIACILLPSKLTLWA